MKSFRTFQEGIENPPLPIVQVSHDQKHEHFTTRNLKNPETRAEINIQLLRATSGGFTNPYLSYFKVMKLLTVYGIALPRPYFPAVDGGEMFWSIGEDGHLADYNPSIPFQENASGYFLYFEYNVDQFGVYVCYAEIVDTEGLERLMEDEEVDGESLDEAKLLATHSTADGSYHAKVYSKNEYGEHTVKFHQNGKHLKDADYHTNDLADAHGTAKAEVKRRGGVNEEVLTELSKKTLSSYAKKASDDVSHHSFQAGTQSAMKEPGSLAHDKKSFKRLAGVHKAIDKITK